MREGEEGGRGRVVDSVGSVGIFFYSSPPPHRHYFVFLSRSLFPLHHLPLRVCPSLLLSALDFGCGFCQMNDVVPSADTAYGLGRKNERGERKRECVFIFSVCFIAFFTFSFC